MLREDHPIYNIWKGMRTRCNNPNVACYHRYGGRGIGIHPSWDDFWKFVEDNPGFVKGLTLDRIDNDKDYGPGNCRWATRAQQLTNHSLSLGLVWKGERVTEYKLAKITGVPRTTIQARRRRGAKTVEEMVYGF